MPTKEREYEEAVAWLEEFAERVWVPPGKREGHRVRGYFRRGRPRKARDPRDTYEAAKEDAAELESKAKLDVDKILSGFTLLPHEDRKKVAMHILARREEFSQHPERIAEVQHEIDKRLDKNLDKWQRQTGRKVDKKSSTPKKFRAFVTNHKDKWDVKVRTMAFNALTTSEKLEEEGAPSKDANEIVEYAHDVETLIEYFEEHPELRGAASSATKAVLALPTAIFRERLRRRRNRKLTIELADWTERYHPRGHGGKFRKKVAGDPYASERVFCGGDIDKALKILSEGGHVQLAQPDEVTVLLDRIEKQTQEAQAKGGKVPNIDLCRVTVKNTNLFCARSKGIPRIKMPQLAGVPTPGSRADGLERDSRGNVTLMPEFIKSLRERGISSHGAEVMPSHLRATQDQLNGRKIAGIMDALEHGVKLEGSIPVARDNYILDGHHRWAAEIGVAAKDDNLDNDAPMPVEVFDVDIGTLLDLARDFAREWGIPQADVDAPVQPGQQLGEWEERKHPRGAGGKFRRKGGPMNTLARKFGVSRKETS